MVSSLSRILLFLITLLALSGCAATRDSRTSKHQTLDKTWNSLGIPVMHHTGLSIYDIGRKKYLFNYNENHLFTPASTVKLLTMFAALEYLDEQIPAAYYHIQGDTMHIWGGGDPGTKYPNIYDTNPFINFLSANGAVIAFSVNHFADKRFGPGWAWDDFPYNFQAERTAYPLYGNKVWIERSTDTVKVLPAYFEWMVDVIKDTVERFTRNEPGTAYTYRYDKRRPSALHSLPASLYKTDIVNIWEETLKKEIILTDRPYEPTARILPGTPRDTLLKIMMQESDNFIAEQLLLVSSMHTLHQINGRSLIRKMMDTSLRDLSGQMVWVDGSGLSRYNLLSPKSVVLLMNKIIALKSLDFVKAIFPAGGLTGTIAEPFKTDNGMPYLFAKSGSMRNVYCLSGVLITRKGTVLAFSWMNNHFVSDPAELKLSMEKLFTFLRDNY